MNDKKVGIDYQKLLDEYIIIPPLTLEEIEALKIKRMIDKRKDLLLAL